MQKRLLSTLAALACTVLAACSTPGGPVPVQNGTTTSSHKLYVVDNNNNLNVYTLPLTASSTPAITVASAGDGGMAISSTQLAVSSGARLVNVFALPITSASVPAFSMAAGSNLNDATFDSAGNLWVTDSSSGTCCIYKYTSPLSASSLPAFTMNEPNNGGYPWGLSFDSTGNLYVAGNRVNDVFAPTLSSSSTGTTFGTNSDNYGIVANGGRVYVANGSGDGSVAVYTTPVAGASTAAFILTPGTSNYIGYPSFDSAGNLYVPVPNDNKIYVYTAPISSTSVPAFSVALPKAYATITGP